ncbi:MAG: TetR/AcrR family transcriptional regulator, partial [Stenotrophomonas bentonitica]
LLLSMIAGLDFEKQRFHIPHRADATVRRRWAEFSVDSFLRAFAAPEAATASHSNQHRSFS